MASSLLEVLVHVARTVLGSFWMKKYVFYLFFFSFNNVVHADKIGLEQKKRKNPKISGKKILDRGLNPRSSSPTATMVYLHFAICMYFEIFIFYIS